MRSQMKTLLASLTLAGLLTGCSTVAPAQLLLARSAYQNSSAGLAAKLAPTEVYDAKKVLDKANQEFAARGDTAAVRDYAYIAMRKFELADVKARTAADRMAIAEAVKEGVVVRDYLVKSTQTELSAARERIKDERSAYDASTRELKATNTAQGKELDSSAARLETERQARMSADAKLAGAMRDLATIAAVKEEARGVVITLSGSVLFASGQYALLETAKTRLDQVAVALKAQSSDKTMVVEGHTDILGSNATNQPLSLNRANAVRDYLVTRGVEPSRLSAVGLGSTRPILGNDSAENRANNRRVEIVIRPPSITER